MVRTQTCGDCELEAFRLGDPFDDQIGGPKKGCETMASGSSARRGNSAPLVGSDDEVWPGDPRYLLKLLLPSSAPALGRSTSASGTSGRWLG